jgi:hypothetical protein
MVSFPWPEVPFCPLDSQVRIKGNDASRRFLFAELYCHYPLANQEN